MHDEEFVKLRHWMDAEFAILHIFLAIIMGYLIHNKLVWIGVVIYVIFKLFYAAVHLGYVESKHKGYMNIPRL